MVWAVGSLDSTFRVDAVRQRGVCHTAYYYNLITC